MIDTDSILHPDNFNESISDLVTNMLESWDVVRRNFDFLQNHIEKVVNKIIRKQNEIHARIEQRRPWANASYHVVKFDNLGDKIRAYIIDSREVITGENSPLIKFEINREIVKNAHKTEVFDKFFIEYEANLVSSIAIKKKNDAEIAAQLLKIDFEKAKEFYLQYKDHFESLEKEIEYKILPFDEWEAKFYTREIDQSAKQDFQVLHGINLDDEIEAIKRQEYNLYVERVKLGIVS